MAKIRAVVLDFDGVLAESNDEKAAAFEEFFALYPEQAPAMRAYHLEHYSSSRYDKFAHYAKLLGRLGDRAVVEEMAAQYAELVVARVIACPPVPGAMEFLLEFSGQIPLYISSVTPQDELRTITTARGVDEFVVEAFGYPPTSKAAAIAAVLEREELVAEEVAFVGDSPSDYHPAAEAGLVFWGRDSGRSFDGLDVDLYADISEIGGVLRRLV